MAEIELLYDAILLGASGYAGKYILREALKYLNVPSSPLKRLGLAGRGAAKVAQALQWAAQPNPPPPDVGIIEADTTNPESLRRLCSKTRLIINCVGPFRLHGEAIVAACVEAGCACLDICGEPEFMERMEVKYHERAEKTGSLVVSACGFDSIPAELGYMFNAKQWIEPAVVNRIETYVNIKSNKKLVANYATLKSAVLGLANVANLQNLRQSRPKRPRPVIPGPPPPRAGPLVVQEKNLGMWGVKLPTGDAVIVRRTLGILNENPQGISGAKESFEFSEHRKAFWSAIKPAHFGFKIASDSWWGIYKFVAAGRLINFFSKSVLRRWFILKFPSLCTLGFFRRSCPSEEEIERMHFKMWFVGQGYSNKSDLHSDKNKEPDMEIVTSVTGPEMGYASTSIIMVQCALVVLSQRDNLPRGGTYPPGIIFGPTDLQERLHKNGVTFDFISKRSLRA